MYLFAVSSCSVDSMVVFLCVCLFFCSLDSTHVVNKRITLMMTMMIN